jgi:hypothetical protein
VGIYYLNSNQSLLCIAVQIGQEVIDAIRFDFAPVSVSHTVAATWVQSLDSELFFIDLSFIFNVFKLVEILLFVSNVCN